MSRTLTPEEEKSLFDAFEKMLSDFDGGEEEEEEDDFGTFDFNFPIFPYDEDLEYPSEPPPIPQEALGKNTCKHEKTKKVFYTDKEAYIMCINCKEDLGDA